MVYVRCWVVGAIDALIKKPCPANGQQPRYGTATLDVTHPHAFSVFFCFMSVCDRFFSASLAVLGLFAPFNLFVIFFTLCVFSPVCVRENFFFF